VKFENTTRTPRYVPAGNSDNEPGHDRKKEKMSGAWRYDVETSAKWAKGSPFKVCAACRRRLPVEAFHKDRHIADGCYPRCKECRKRDRLERRGDTS
jgi:hypothetical protein